MTLRSLALAAAAGLALAGPVAAQTVAITGATIHPVSGPVIERGTVLLRDGRIAAVGADVAIPEGARRIDGTGKVVTPGFIHAATAIGLGVGRQLQEETDEEYTAIGGTTDNNKSGDVNASFNVAEALDPAAIAIPVARLGGTTTAIVSPGGSFVGGQAVAIDLDGETIEAMLVKSPVAMTMDLSDRSRSAGGGSRAAAVQRLRQLFVDARTLRARRAAYTENRLRELSAPADELEALWPVLDGRLPVVIRARRRSDIETVMRVAREFRLRVILAGSEEAWQVAPALARAGIPVILDPRDNIPSFDGLGARYDNAALLRAAGVSVIVAGQDAGGANNLRFEAGHAVRNGLAWEDALAAVTLAPARAFGLADRYGTLEPGKVADVVLWSGDPFEFSSAAEAVFIRGREVPRTSRMTELLERYRTLPPTY